jgi:hypothetical protein
MKEKYSQQETPDQTSVAWKAKVKVGKYTLSATSGSN